MNHQNLGKQHGEVGESPRRSEGRFRLEGFDFGFP